MNCLSEETILAFSDGRLAPEGLIEVEVHSRGCATCRELLSFAVGGDEVPNPSASLLPRGASVSRYTVLALVGRGGMGEVYSAYDPELDRKIALKLLHSERGAGDSRGQGRLLREAKAMAKLSHRNVVAVHDVGSFSGRVFVAMEFVDGHTVKEWLAERPRSRAEILDVFVAAARGLAAAHAIRMVHRDFKPHNVMVGKDGSVRVMDFGLARQISEASEPAEAHVALTPIASAPDAALTQTGELVGTPLYMAPEQFEAQPTDARTDQFSFCVALHEALYGAHPFGRGSLSALMGNVLGGRLVPPPPGRDVPSWLRRVLLRGLRVEPSLRWGSMDELVAALELDPGRARRRWATAIGGTLLVSLAAVAVVRATGQAAPICDGGPARLAGLWESVDAPAAARPRHEALHAAFLATGVPRAEDIWTRIAPALDRYATRWLSMYREACEATHVSGGQSEATLDLRMSCLDERRVALGALTDVLAAADGVAVNSAVDAVGALPGIDQCADLVRLRAVVAPPRDEATARRVEDLRRRAATAKALDDTGHPAEAAKRSRALVAEARGVDYAPVLAELLSLLGRVQDGVLFRPEAAATLEEAVWTALAAGRDDVVVEAGAPLASFVGYYLRRPQEGWRWAHLTMAIVDRMGGSHELPRARVLHGEGNIKMQEHDLEGALALFRGALAIKEKVLPADDPDIGTSLAAVAETENRLGRSDEAVRLNERAIEIRRRRYGDDASQVAQLLSNQGEYLLASGRSQEAVTVFREAIARWESGSLMLGYPLTGLGRALLALGRPAEAVPVLEKALVNRKGGDPDLLVETGFALGRALWAAGQDRARARLLVDDARAGYAKASDEPHLKEVDAWLAGAGRR